MGWGRLLPGRLLLTRVNSVDSPAQGFIPPGLPAPGNKKI